MSIAGGVALGSPVSAASAQASNKTSKSKPVKILGISCSPRKGMTTATAIKATLGAAKQVDKRINVELIDLGSLEISGWSGGAKPTEAKQIKDDFDLITCK